MKTLVIGVDGTSIETFKRGWTPNIESLIEKGNQLQLKEDLLSRGWVEIFTGKHALETGALYDLPLANGSLNWTTKFKLESIPNWKTEIKPIWQILNERGYKVGIMNIPTTFPAPKVKGFFVSGGGGGAKVIQEASDELCYPKDIVEYLHRINYIIDVRMPELYEKNFITVEKVFSHFQLKNEKRTEAFIKLSKEKKVDFGFVVYKTSSVMVEFFTIPELEKKNKGEKFYDKKLLNYSEKYYRNFDKQFQKLVDSFKGAEIIIVSDHSERKTDYEVNLNYFLQTNGFQAKHRQTPLEHVSKYLKYFAKTYLPFNIKKNIFNHHKSASNGIIMANQYSSFDPDNTAAFCVPWGDWARGIYINDTERFNGIIPSNKVIELSQKISEKINSDKIAQMHNISSHIKSHFDTPISKYYPDIVVDIPDGYIVRNNGANFITQFNGLRVKQYDFDTVEAWSKLRAQQKWLPLTVRGYEPIAVSSRQWSNSILTKKNDLTTIYKHLLNQYQPKKNTND